MKYSLLSVYSKLVTMTKTGDGGHSTQNMTRADWTNDKINKDKFIIQDS